MRLKRTFKQHLKNLFRKRVRVVTHDSTFHADDIFSVAALNLYYDGNIKIIRSRDPKIIETGDVVLDVGRVYDPVTNRYDHHQEGGAGKRPDGILFSSFGLIWKHFGPKLAPIEEVWKNIDHKLVRPIDIKDTGFDDMYIESIKDHAWTFDKILKNFNPLDFTNVRHHYGKFIYCVNFATDFLRAYIGKQNRKHTDSIEMDEIYKSADDKRIMIMPRYMSACEDFFMTKPDVLYMIFPDFGSSQYRVRAVPSDESFFIPRKRFPESWRGKIGAELEKVSGIKGVSFCHNNGHLASTSNFESAVAMAKIAVDI